MKRGPIDFYRGVQRARIPMVDADNGHEIFWAIQQLPTPYLRQASGHRLSGASKTQKTTPTIRAVQVGTVELGRRVASITTEA
jgi:hypothetical protein